MKEAAGQEKGQEKEQTKGEREPPSQKRLLGYLLLLMLLFFLLEQVVKAGSGDLLDLDRLVDGLRENQSWAWVAILVMWLIQAVVAPLPAFVLTMATAILYGDTITGALFAILLTWAGAMLGAVLCFGLARWLGRDWVVRRGYLDRMQDLDSYLEEKGAFVIFLSRLIPIVSFDLVSYVAGVTRIKWRDFVVATGTGMIPATVLLVLFAYFTMNQEQTYFIVISILGLILLAVASYLLTWLMNDYRNWQSKFSKDGSDEKAANFSTDQEEGEKGEKDDDDGKNMEEDGEEMKEEDGA